MSEKEADEKIMQMMIRDAKRKGLEKGIEKGIDKGKKEGIIVRQ